VARAEEWINIGNDPWERRGHDTGEQHILHQLDIGDVIGMPVKGNYINEDKVEELKAIMESMFRLKYNDLYIKIPMHRGG